LREKRGLPETLSIDSGVVLAYLLGEDLGKIARDEILSRERRVYCSRVAVSELFYILCKRREERFARDATEALLKSGRLSVVSWDEVDMEAGAYKCARSVSLADCYVLAVAKVFNAAAVFAKREDDLDREADKKPFDVEMVFLEDLVKESKKRRDR
jgi:predicted nucleic acid-binding protein